METVKKNRLVRKKDIDKKVCDLIDERNNLIHGGVLEGIQLDYKYLNSLYCLFILNIVNDINIIDSSTSEYLSNYYNNFK